MITFPEKDVHILFRVTFGTLATIVSLYLLIQPDLLLFHYIFIGLSLLIARALISAKDKSEFYGLICLYLLLMITNGDWYGVYTRV
jgi:hypothetical protein